MRKFISGITDTNNIKYCPRCGAGIRVFLGNGTVRCRDCSYHFGVVDYGITSGTVSNTGHPVKKGKIQSTRCALLNKLQKGGRCYEP